MFPIRCLVECVNEGECVKCNERGTTIADSFAIVAGQTPLSQLIETVLAALGLQHLASGAKGWIQVKNWKPLSFDQITDDPELEIEYILKDVSNQLTLRILTKQSDAAAIDCVRDMKDRLLKATLQKTPKLLQDAANFQPQLKDLVLQLVQGDATPSSIDAQQVLQFNLWLDELTTSTVPATSANRPQIAYVGGISSNGLITHASSSTSQHWNGQSASANNHVGHNHHPHYHPYHRNHNHGVGGSSTGGGNNPNHSTPGATRFSPLLEVPKLERWFRENSNPSRQKLQHLMQILNGSNFRKHAGKITYQQICNWFSNARASHRRKDGTSTTAALAAASNNLPQNNSDQISIIHQQSIIDQRPNSASGIGAVVGQQQVTTPPNHWVSKVFSNNVRNLSIAFNDFIQSTPPSATTTSVAKLSKSNSIVVDGAASTPAAISTSSANISQNQHHQHQQTNSIRAATSPSVETSSTSSQSPASRSRDVSINVIRDDGTVAMTFKEEDDDEDGEGDSRMRIVLENVNDEATGLTFSPSISPMSISATLKAAMIDGFPTMAAPNRVVANVTPTSAAAANAAAQAAAAAQAYGAGANRTRLMFDPLTELPMLEKWFEENPHPSWAQVDQYTEQLNALSYRQTYPPVSSHNLKIWFKNRRAKCKRLMTGGGGLGDGVVSHG